MDAVSLISGSSAFSKSSFNIWKFMVRILLKPRLEKRELYSMSICILLLLSKGQIQKNPPAVQEMQETQVQSLGWEDPLEKGIAIPSSILAWRIPRTEEPGGLQPTGSQRVGCDSACTQD